MPVIIQASSAVIEEGLVGDLWIEVSENTIKSVNLGVHSSPDQSITGVLIPGFIDIHCHGGAGSYFSHASKISEVIAIHRNHGTTGIIASLVTESIDDLKFKTMY